MLFIEGCLLFVDVAVVDVVDVVVNAGDATTVMLGGTTE